MGHALIFGCLAQQKEATWELKRVNLLRCALEHVHICDCVPLSMCISVIVSQLG